jgi:hypothetical protein
MKKVLFALLVVFVSVNLCFAANARKNAGCGLGAMLINPNNDTLVGNLAMTFLNGTFGTQTFGITTGTSECDKPTHFVKNEKIQEFVVANMDNLAKDIVVGKGETLDSFAELLNIPVEQRPAFYAKLHENFVKIFVSENVQMAEVIDNVISEMAKN